MRPSLLIVTTGFTYCIVTGQMAFGAAFRRGSASSTSRLDLISTLSLVANSPSISDTRLSQIASSILSNLSQIKRYEDPTIEPVLSTWDKISPILTNGSADILGFANEIAASGLIPPSILSFLNDYIDISLNSIYNNNPPSRNLSIYPFKAKGDAPYSVAEKFLRSAIHIPNSFSYGKEKKIPVLLVPGTAVPAGTTFYFNFGKLGAALPESDIVWVNIPRASLGDIQYNAEYVAYAINYISTLSSSKIAVISWSQGALNTQWALKYWPSTRDTVEDFVAISPDFHGTVVTWFVCPLLSLIFCTPSTWQQGWDAEFIKVLRDGGGDSAYVPTTTIYSSFDRVVKPMSGENASAILLDSRGVGVSNNNLQTICANKAAGGVYSHEGVLYNPIAWALTVDAVHHNGPGNISRINIEKICEQVVPPQLGLIDILGTEAIMLVALAELIAYLPKAFGEPSIASYAFQQDRYRREALFLRPLDKS